MLSCACGIHDDERRALSRSGLVRVREIRHGVDPPGRRDDDRLTGLDLALERLNRHSRGSRIGAHRCGAGQEIQGELVAPDIERVLATELRDLRFGRRGPNPGVLQARPHPRRCRARSAGHPQTVRRAP